MDRLAYRVVAAEREGHVGHPARAQGVGEVVADVGAGVDEIDRVVVVFLDAGGDGEDVRIEDDVFRWEADFVDQDVVGALADFFLARLGVGLAVLVEGHHHHRGAVALAQAGMVLEGLDAFLHRDRVDDALALDALQAGLDHFPLGGVDHDRHARDVGLGGDQVEEGDHGRLRVQHAFVHVDVDHLGAGFHLLLGDLESFRVVFLADQPGELGRTGDVGALADVDEQRAAVDGERLQAGQATGPGISGMARGGYLATALAIASMCAGVVPQQPPTILRKPAAANSSTTTAISAGDSSYSPKAFGRPALGWAET